MGGEEDGGKDGLGRDLEWVGHELLESARSRKEVSSPIWDGGVTNVVAVPREFVFERVQSGPQTRRLELLEVELSPQHLVLSFEIADVLRDDRGGPLSTAARWRLGDDDGGGCELELSFELCNALFELGDMLLLAVARGLSSV